MLGLKLNNVSKRAPPPPPRIMTWNYNRISKCVLHQIWISLVISIQSKIPLIHMPKFPSHMVCQFAMLNATNTCLFELRVSLPENILFWICNSSRVGAVLDFLVQYWIEHATIGLFYVKSVFPARIYYRRGPGFATDYPLGIWCRKLTNCLQYVTYCFGI